MQSKEFARCRLSYYTIAAIGVIIFVIWGFIRNNIIDDGIKADKTFYSQVLEILDIFIKFFVDLAVAIIDIANDISQLADDIRNITDLLHSVNISIP